MKQIRSLLQLTAEHQGSSENAKPSKDGVEKEELLFSGTGRSLAELSRLQSIGRAFISLLPTALTANSSKQQTQQQVHSIPDITSAQQY